MKMPLALVLTITGILLFAGSKLSAAEKVEQKYRFTVSMNQWDCDANRDVWDQTEVKVNGKSVGRYEKGFRALELLPVETGERIKLEFPACPNARTCRPAHWISSFIHRWMEKGAFVDWYQGGKEFETHTVTWKDFTLRGKADYVHSMNEVTWIVDGKTIGKGIDLVNFIEPWKKKKRLIVQIVYPVDWNPPIAVDPDSSLYGLELLNDGKNVRAYNIRVPKKAPAPEH